jgi:hypothetical protein
MPCAHCPQFNFTCTCCCPTAKAQFIWFFDIQFPIPICRAFPISRWCSHKHDRRRFDSFFTILLYLIRHTVCCSEQQSSLNA